MDIDFVILWVDGNDEDWRRERRKASSICNTADNNEFRYRDWDNLQYLFRGIEKFTPWVRTVHFVTWGHLPKWLNTGHPKLHIVRHQDYMKPEYLPCFNSEALEVCLHKIEGLAEHFVYFNDDMFILREMKKEDFFVKGLPCDSGIMNVHCCELEVGGTLCNFLNIGIINRHFHMHSVLRRHWKQWFSLKYGFHMLRNIYLLPCPRFPGMLMQHLPNPYLKSTFAEVWDKEYELLDQTCKNKFRSLNDVNQWIFKEWQLASGRFATQSPNMGVSLLPRDITRACKIVEHQKYKMLSFNDEDIPNHEFLRIKKRINNSFDKIFPNPSRFEMR